LQIAIPNGLRASQPFHDLFCFLVQGYFP
jgi:hypothetical protein